MGFASYLYYDNTKATVAGYNSSSITNAPNNWGTANQTTTTASTNPNIPIQNAGAFFYQNLDNNFVGINLPTTPVLLLTVTYNIISGNGGQVYLGQSYQVPGLAYTDSNTDSYNVVVEGLNGVSLPVKLTHFQAEAKDADALLSWQSESEHNLSHYDIERSTDQQHWQNIGKVDGKGDTNTAANYQWTDAGALRNATGDYLYYRLKMVDTDATSEYSPIRSVRVLKPVKTVHVQPNPTTNALYIAYDIDEAAAITVSLYDNTGKLVLLTTYKSGMPVDVSALPRGVYSLQLTDRSTVLATERVVLQ